MLERNFYDPEGEEGIQAVQRDIDNHPYRTYIEAGINDSLENDLKDLGWNEPAFLYTLSIFYFNDKKTYFQMLVEFINRGREILDGIYIN